MRTVDIGAMTYLLHLALGVLVAGELLVLIVGKQVLGLVAGQSLVASYKQLHCFNRTHCSAHDGGSQHMQHHQGVAHACIS